jgi:hypothetical protein
VNMRWKGAAVTFCTFAPRQEISHRLTTTRDYTTPTTAPPLARDPSHSPPPSNQQADRVLRLRTTPCHPVRYFLSFFNRTGQMGDGREERCIAHVLATAPQGDARAALDAYESFAEKKEW